MGVTSVSLMRRCRFADRAGSVRNAYSDSHVPECEQPHQKGIGLHRLPDFLPVFECPFRIPNQSENLLSRETPRHVVVRFVAELLKEGRRTLLRL